MIEDAIKEMLDDIERNHPRVFEGFMKRSGFVKCKEEV